MPRREFANIIDAVRIAGREAYERERHAESVERVEELSPCGKYFLIVEYCATVVACEVQDAVTRCVINKLIKLNEHGSFYTFVTSQETDYFLFAEELSGQSVLNLHTGEVAGYAIDGDDFIWTRYALSPDGTRLAVEGCYWACPYQVTVYDFRTPMQLPLPILAQHDLPPRCDSAMGDWADNYTINIRVKDEATGAWRDLPLA